MHTLIDWIKKVKVESGPCGGVPTEMAEKMKALARSSLVRLGRSPASRSACRSRLRNVFAGHALALLILAHDPIVSEGAAGGNPGAAQSVI